MSTAGGVDARARGRLLRRMRTGARTAVLNHLATTVHGELVTTAALAVATRYEPGTVRDAAKLAQSVGLVYSAPVPGRYPPPVGWAITPAGRAFLIGSRR